MKENNNLFKQLIIIAFFTVMTVLLFLRIETAKEFHSTEDVINFAIRSRGATQRIVKLEIADIECDQLIENLDIILTSLSFGSADFELAKIEDIDYQKQIIDVSESWKEVKNEIYLAREVGYINTDLIDLSERHIIVVEEAVSALERYSNDLDKKLAIIEFSMFITILLCLIYLIINTIIGFRVAKLNKELKKIAFIDSHTNLNNKSKCLDVLDSDDLVENKCFVVFDLNYLKKVNDEFGHDVGDTLIKNFATVLKNVIPKNDFVGRFGGDEFLSILDYTDKSDALEIINNLDVEIERFNKEENQVPISFAKGYAFSEDYEDYTLLELMKVADENMYTDKRKCHNILDENAKKI